MIIPIAIVNNESTVCHTCGRCCRDNTTVVWPDQVELTEQGIADRLSQGYIVGTYTNYHGTWHYIQPKAAEDGSCIFLTPTGCSFTFEDRPRLCQTYTPQPDRVSCYHPEGQAFEDAVRAWKPYESLLLHYTTQ